MSSDDDKDYYDFIYNLAIIYHKHLENYEEAEKFYLKALEVASN